MSLRKIFKTKVFPLPQEWHHKGQVIRLNPLKRARNIRLAYDSKRDHFRLTTPVYITKREIEKFLTHADSWFDEKIKRAEDFVTMGHGTVVSILGEACQIHFQKDIKRKVVFDSEMITISDSRDKHMELLEVELRQKSLEFLTKKSHEFAAALGVSIKKVVVRDTYSRWGSCAASGNLSYSWRLIFAPLEVLEYVCAHEVSHRKHMNHSQDFWQTVASICPNYRKHRAWLKAEGKQVFSYRF